MQDDHGFVAKLIINSYLQISERSDMYWFLLCTFVLREGQRRVCTGLQDPRFIYVGRVLLRTYYKVVNLQRSKLNLQRSKLNLQRSKRSKLTYSAVS